METSQNGFSEFLRQDYAEKRKKNSRFSLRSYAKTLRISPSHLSQILADKRKVNAKSALMISECLGLTPSESFALLNGGPGKYSFFSLKKILSIDEFSLISEWYYYAILGVANLKTNSTNMNWLAKKLSLPQTLVQKAYKELIKHQHLIEEAGQFRQSSEFHRTSDDIPSFKIRRYHKQNLHLASEKLDQIPTELREYCTMTIPINPKRMKAAKELIRKFREEFSEELARGNKTEVYNLCIQFFPLTQPETVSPRD
jgi:transcriptional regulator with XRE-family HTH domain